MQTLQQLATLQIPCRAYYFVLETIISYAHVLYLLTQDYYYLGMLFVLIVIIYHVHTSTANTCSMSTNFFKLPSFFPAWDYHHLHYYHGTFALTDTAHWYQLQLFQVTKRHDTYFHSGLNNIEFVFREVQPVRYPGNRPLSVVNTWTDDKQRDSSSGFIRQPTQTETKQKKPW